jgi:hypothetical protein
MMVGSSEQDTVNKTLYAARNKNSELFIYHVLSLNMQIQHYIESL